MVGWFDVRQRRPRDRRVAYFGMEWCVIGIDPAASKRLVAVVSLGTDFEIETRTMPRDPLQRYVVAYRWVRMLVNSAPKPVAVFIEEPVLGAGGAGGTLPLAKVHGAMLAAAVMAGADFVLPAHPATWKARVIGKMVKGRHKPQIKAHVRKHWNELYEEVDGNQDVCDAACINRYGVEVLRLRKLLEQQGARRRRRPVR